jgi:dodecin
MADSGKTFRITEVVGTSSESIHQAVRNGIARASKTLHGLEWFEVLETRGSIDGGTVREFQVTMKIGFRLDD